MTVSTQGIETWPYPVVTPDTAGQDIGDMIRAERAGLREMLGDQGAILLRGFGIGSVDGFDAVVFDERNGRP